MKVGAGLPVIEMGRGIHSVVLHSARIRHVVHLGEVARNIAIGKRAAAVLGIHVTIVHSTWLNSMCTLALDLPRSLRAGDGNSHLAFDRRTEPRS